MVCARYRYTAHITRLFQSSDPALPNVLHGNTCAHEMNVVSTTSVLPRTPSDVNETLSVVFVGPGKFRREFLKDVYRIRKQKVWRFLTWLTTHNLLYLDMHLDKKILDLYPEDDILPGIAENVVEDHVSDVSQIFLEETAGPSEHPAELLKDPISKSDEPFVFLEKVGVSDPEGDRLSGRTFISSALRNLVSDMGNSTLPDLILHRGSTAIKEYKNPELMPGMFPTLWPFGIGGFEKLGRPVSLSFPKQANYYFDLPDKCFRTHNSFLFVTLNIIQRRAAHLHTHFTVRKSNFPSIAEKLITVTPEALLSTARHLEHEGKYQNLTDEQRNAMNLLKSVNAVSARIPGSHALQIHIRNEIRNYFGYFGMPQLYFTANPSATHSPIFQLMCGDTNVDLSKRFPQLAPSCERALRLAKDPVAAADFFDFSIQCIFEFLFGWDYSKKKSKPEGGILGHLRAFYGTAELTERANFHGHFLLWLMGGLNPSQLHERLATDEDFKHRFFDFFEDIIHHHLPQDDGINIDSLYEPRIERPPRPPHPTQATLDELNSWDSAFITQIKICGEALQRHVCRPVCHKYGNEGRCRFLFPHEIIEASYFDPDSKSIVLMCRDSTVNYFNPYILVFCRHNHDIKCILSGKAAKAASFYITDYITKMGPKTYEMLSLLSKAVSNMPPIDDCSASAKAKILLHKCLSQFTRQQQIHGQQAARYIRGKGDGMSSHNTRPMMSSILVSNVKSIYVPQNSLYGSDNESEDEECEPISLRIAIDNEGRLMTSNQFHDYYYRALSLQSMNFFDFARSVKLEKKSNAPKDSSGTRPDTLKRHTLMPEHKLADSHQLVQFWNEEQGHKEVEYVPSVVGCSIPRPNAGLSYQIFVLAHFKPFGFLCPLVPKNESFDTVFQNYTLSDAAKTVIRNLDATNECEDARDAERMRKTAQMTKESRALTNSLFMHDSCIPVVDSDVENQSSAKADFAVNQHLLLLQQSNWFKSPVNQSSQPSFHLPTMTDILLKQWKISLKNQESASMQKRRCQADIKNPTTNISDFVSPTEHPGVGDPQKDISSICAETDAPKLKMPHQTVNTDHESIINRIGTEAHLNSKQWISFRIIARSFIKINIDISDKPEPIRMLMTGPAGTGKTHVVNAVRALMAEYGDEHTLRLLAPTGTAASLIDGMTIHKGLGIKIKSNRKGKGNRNPGDSSEDYTVLISVRNRTLLRDEWRLVKVLFIDEVSLLSQQLICEVDHALRYATERPDEWFGGICVIFSGDFCQYPPIGGTPLYVPIPHANSRRKDDVPRRLGRLAWKSINAVVSLTDQECMKGDAEYSRAVNNLRTRQCTLEDIDLFNSRVIKSAQNTNGIDMNTANKASPTAIISTNLLRETINARKAHANCTGPDSPTLITCAAINNILCGHGGREIITHLLTMNMTKLTAEGALPGFAPLYVGMPIILRHRNISTELRVTNGSQGYVRQINTENTIDGLTFAKSVIVEFPMSKACFEQLPPHYFPITPISWTFATKVNGELIRVNRQQVPIQPAFAVTGHSAEGKTLPNVLANLHEGGFGAYVAASRPTSCEGLFVSRPVSLEMLNHPLPYDLHVELQRLKIMEHNTLIKYGFEKGIEQKILDPEAESHLQTTEHNIIRPKFEFEEAKSRLTKDKKRKATKDAGPQKKKRRCEDGDSKMSLKSLSPPPNSTKRAPASVDILPIKVKKQKTSKNISDQNTLFKHDPLPAGCIWSQANWSCAYDAFFMIFFYIHHSSTELWTNSWRHYSPLASALHENFSSLSVEYAQGHQSTFDEHRDQLRDILFARDPNIFPRYGPMAIDVADIFEQLNQNGEHVRTLSIQHICPPCNYTPPSVSIRLPTTVHPALLPCSGEDQLTLSTQFTIQEWMDALITANAESHRSVNVCPTCSTTAQLATIFFQPSPFLHFEIPPEMRSSVLPSRIVTISNTDVPSHRYLLRGIIYHGQLHFTARLVTTNNITWTYDGQLNRGIPVQEHNPSDDVRQLTTLQDRQAYVYVYQHVPQPALPV